MQKLLGLLVLLFHIQKDHKTQPQLVFALVQYVKIEKNLRTGKIKLNKFNSSPIIIGSNCWIGAKATILRKSVLGENVIVGAHSLVKGEIPSFSLAIGIPAIIKKSLK